MISAIFWRGLSTPRTSARRSNFSLKFRPAEKRKLKVSGFAGSRSLGDTRGTGRGLMASDRVGCGNDVGDIGAAVKAGCDGVFRMEGVKTGLGAKRDQVFFCLALGHPSAILEKLLDVTIRKNGRKEACHRETHSVLRQREEYLRKTSGHIGHLNSQSNRAFAQTKASRAVIPEILVPTLEIAPSSRHFCDVSDDERHIPFLGADQLLG
jgi:hypothetical protein